MRFPARLLLALTAGASAIAAVELALRQIPMAPPGGGAAGALGDENADSRCSRPSLTRLWEPLPSTCARNSRGWFGAESPTARLRVLVLGDSIAAQRQWVDIAAAALGPDVDVQNAGVSGYDPCQELRLLEEQGLAWEPDLVLVQLCPNDIGGSPALVPLPSGRYRYHVGTRAFDIPALALKSRLLSWVYIRGGAAWAARAVARDEAGAREATRRCLQGIATSGPPVAAVLFPILVARDADPAPLQLGYEDALRGQLRELEIPFLDLRPVFEDAGSMADYQSNPDDRLHPNRLGQSVAGTAVVEFLRGRLAAPR